MSLFKTYKGIKIYKDYDRYNVMLGKKYYENGYLQNIINIIDQYIKEELNKIKLF